MFKTISFSLFTHKKRPVIIKLRTDVYEYFLKNLKNLEKTQLTPSPICKKFISLLHRIFMMNNVSLIMVNFNYFYLYYVFFSENEGLEPKVWMYKIDIPFLVVDN